MEDTYMQNKTLKKATHIQWSTDDRNVLESLPTEIQIPLEMDEEGIGDYLSEQTGYLHEGYVLEQDAEKKQRVFVDMDGTLYAFHDDILDNEGHVQIEKMYEKDFFLKLKSFERMHEALKLLHENPNTEIYILSSADKLNIVDQKIKVIERDFGFIDRDHMLFPKTWENKANAIPNSIQKSDILIDDYNVNLEAWEQAGGQAVKFVNNINHNAQGRFGGDKGNLWQGAMVTFYNPPEVIVQRLNQFINREKDPYLLEYPDESMNKNIMEKTLEQFGEWNMCEHRGTVYVAFTGDLEKDVTFDYKYIQNHVLQDAVDAYPSYAAALSSWINEIDEDIFNVGVLDDYGNHNFYLNKDELGYCGLLEDYEYIVQRTMDEISNEPAVKRTSNSIEREGR